MSVYAIGDVQGCYTALTCLLDKLAFDRDRDELWFAGDLVNRGPDSLSCLRLIRELNAKVVLGNHDLHLLACYYSSKHSPKRKDTLDSILSAPDVDELMAWLKGQPLMHWDRQRDLLMSHAGLPHIWSIEQAMALNKEVCAVLQGENFTAYFDQMYGNQPSCWSEDLCGQERLRVITNYFTRMRFIKSDGSLDFAAKESIGSGPDGFLPWFDYELKTTARVLFGHWAALEGVTGKEQVVALDTGCVWGGALTAMNVDSGELVRCSCGGKS